MKNYETTINSIDNTSASESWRAQNNDGVFDRAVHTAQFAVSPRKHCSEEVPGSDSLVPDDVAFVLFKETSNAGCSASITSTTVLDCHDGRYRGELSGASDEVVLKRLAELLNHLVCWTGCGRDDVENSQ